MRYAGLVCGGMVAVTGCHGDGNPFNSRQPGEYNATSTSGSTAGGGEGGQLFTGGAGGGSGGTGPVCTGADGCYRSATAPFVRITMVSIGKPEEVQPCPPWAPLGFEGFADLTIAPHACPSCSCSPASCALPQAMHVSAAKCANAAGATSLDFNAPAGGAWEGNCTAENGIAPGLLCGGQLCAQSLTIEPPELTPCQPISEGNATLPAPSWTTMARECSIHVDDEGEGCGDGQSCAPVPPAGFVLCLSAPGHGYDCPPEYPRSFQMYDAVQDGRACAPCTCGDVEGTGCAAFVAAYSDNACGQQMASVVVTPGQGACVDLPNGTALGSKSASFIDDKPGACTSSGGKPTGAIEPVGPVTLCCQPDVEKVPE